MMSPRQADQLKRDKADRARSIGFAAADANNSGGEIAKAEALK